MILDTIFFGSSDYCLPVLKALNKNFKLLVIITRPDKPVGRKKVLTPSLPKQFALSHNIQVFTPKDKESLLVLQEKIKNLNPDIGIVADYGLIIPKEIYTLPRSKTLNIHFSKLPEFRGPSPVQYTILSGKKSAWISILFVTEELDAGDILWQKEAKLFNNEVIQQSSHYATETLYKKLFNITALELPSVLSLYAQKKLKPQKQDHKKATYTKLLTRNDGYIPPKFLTTALEGKNCMDADSPLLHLPAGEAGCFIVTLLPDTPPSISIERAIRAFTPWPGVWTKIAIEPFDFLRQSSKQAAQSKQSSNEAMKQCLKKRLKILKAHLKKERRTKNEELRTKLVIDKVQLEGKKPVTWKQFRAGYPNFSF